VKFYDLFALFFKAFPALILAIVCWNVIAALPVFLLVMLLGVLGFSR
jgi:hypothetical protein